VAVKDSDEFTRWMLAQEIIRQGQGGRPVRHSTCSLTPQKRADRAVGSLTVALALVVLALLAVAATRYVF
jgi:hypothetical protein